MATLKSDGHRRALGGVRLGATTVPLWLLLLPKCPLCLIPLFAALGIAITPSTGLLVVAGGILVLAWLSVLLYFSRDPLIRISALLLAIVCGFGIAAQNRTLVWSAVVAMMAVGIVVSRTCVRAAGEGASCNPHTDLPQQP